jgi:two-component system, chemotaxis family, chemotaxis protein CheY
MSGRILVIDDSEHVRAVIRMTLKFKGYEVETAENGSEGLKLAMEDGFDAIFCDIEMPVMGGVEFVEKYREARGDRTPVIILTAEEGNAARAAIQAGASMVLTKPFEPIRLLDEVERQLSLKP